MVCGQSYMTEKNKHSLKVEVLLLIKANVPFRSGVAREVATLMQTAYEIHAALQRLQKFPQGNHGHD